MGPKSIIAGDNERWHTLTVLLNYSGNVCTEKDESGEDFLYHQELIKLMMMGCTRAMWTVDSGQKMTCGDGTVSIIGGTGSRNLQGESLIVPQRIIGIGD